MQGQRNRLRRTVGHACKARPPVTGLKVTSARKKEGWLLAMQTSGAVSSLRTEMSIVDLEECVSPISTTNTIIAAWFKNVQKIQNCCSDFVTLHSGRLATFKLQSFDLTWGRIPQSPGLATSSDKPGA